MSGRNIRELEHVIERAVLISEGPILTIQPLAAVSHHRANLNRTLPTSNGRAKRTLAEAERDHVADVLQMTNGLVAGKGGAAEVRGVPASTLRNRMKRLGLKSR